MDTRFERPVYARLRRLCVSLPGVEEGTSYRTPAWKVKGKLFARRHQDGETLVIAIDFEEREAMMEEDPETFYITDHYLNYAWVLVRLAKVRVDQLPDVLRQAWRRAAPRHLLSTLRGFHVDS